MNKKLSNHKTSTQSKRSRISPGDNIYISETQLKKIRCLLLAQAHKKHGQIKPCGTWDKCFTIEDNTIFFWYQTSKDNSTHLVAHNLNNLYPSSRNRISNIGLRIKIKKYSENQVQPQPEYENRHKLNTLGLI
jgi:hypothetical protein